MPVIANVRPSGKFLMEDFYYAGGLPRADDGAAGYARSVCMTVTGRTLGENIEAPGSP